MQKSTVIGMGICRKAETEVKQFVKKRKPRCDGLQMSTDRAMGILQKKNTSKDLDLQNSIGKGIGVCRGSEEEIWVFSKGLRYGRLKMRSRSIDICRGAGAEVW